MKKITYGTKQYVYYVIFNLKKGDININMLIYSFKGTKNRFKNDYKRVKGTEGEARFL